MIRQGIMKIMESMEMDNLHLIYYIYTWPMYPYTTLYSQNSVLHRMVTYLANLGQNEEKSGSSVPSIPVKTMYAIRGIRFSMN